MSAQVEKLLKLLQEHCTVKSIRRLLSKAKDTDKTITISAKNKETIIQRNLRAAITRKAITLNEVYKELYDAEENGGQHIFYYLTNSKHSLDARAFEKYIDGDAVATRVFGADWRKEVGEPLFHLEPKNFVWSVFRIVDYPEGRSGWVAKLYAGLPRKELIEETKKGDTLTKVWRLFTSREVYLARYHPFGVLEVRIPLAESREEVIQSRDQFLKLLEKGFQIPDDFVSWELVQVQGRLKDRAVANANKYRLGPIRLRDLQRGTTTVCPPSSEEDVCSDPARAATLKLFKESDHTVLTWLTNGQLEEDLRTIIGKLAKNEVLISAKATAEAVDYVTYRLREFGP
jgi:hypothetical protein